MLTFSNTGSSALGTYLQAVSVAHSLGMLQQQCCLSSVQGAANCLPSPHRYAMQLWPCLKQRSDSQRFTCLVVDAGSGPAQNAPQSSASLSRYCRHSCCCSTRLLDCAVALQNVAIGSCIVCLCDWIEWLCTQTTYPCIMPGCQWHF